jgi:hypothetical protein
MSTTRFFSLTLLILCAGLLARTLPIFLIAFSTLAQLPANSAPLTTLILVFARVTTKEFLSAAPAITSQLFYAMIAGFAIGRLVWIWRQFNPRRSDYYTYHLKWIAAFVLINVLHDFLPAGSPPPHP